MGNSPCYSPETGVEKWEADHSIGASCHHAGPGGDTGGYKPHRGPRKPWLWHGGALAEPCSLIVAAAGVPGDWALASRAPPAGCLKFPLVGEDGQCQELESFSPAASWGAEDQDPPGQGHLSTPPSFSPFPEAGGSSRALVSPSATVREGYLLKRKEEPAGLATRFAFKKRYFWLSGESLSYSKSTEGQV